MVHKEYIAVCDICSVWLRFTNRTIPAIRAKLKKMGWTRGHNNGKLIDACDLCSANIRIQRYSK